MSGEPLRLELLGRLCPIPVIELAKRIGDVDVGGLVVVVSDDPAAATDIPAWCRMRGHDYVGSDGTAYTVRRVH
jgi:TusA-related sulfurtransferase